MLEPIFRYRDSVSASVPFTHQPGARFRLRPRSASDSAFRPEHLRESPSACAASISEAAMSDFLEPVANSFGQKVTTDSWRLAPIKP